MPGMRMALHALLCMQVHVDAICQPSHCFAITLLDPPPPTPLLLLYILWICQNNRGRGGEEYVPARPTFKIRYADLGIGETEEEERGGLNIKPGRHDPNGL